VAFFHDVRRLMKRNVMGPATPIKPRCAGDEFGEHAATISGVLDHLGLADATIADRSMGGLIALQVACGRSDRVAMIVIGVGAFSQPLIDFPQNRLNGDQSHPAG
jgi:pimeloyl-ACP methyl ester carboxylesterase